MKMTNHRWDSAQLNAICHRDGPLLVAAGPGAGKTSVITSHVNYLITQCHVRPENILVVTFTKAAAQEMKERFQNMSKNTSPKDAGSEGPARKNPASPSPRFGTMHSVFFEILRKSEPQKSFCFIEDSDRDEYLKSLIAPYKQQRRTVSSTGTATYPGTTTDSGAANYPGTATYPGTTTDSGAANYPGTANYSGTANYPDAGIYPNAANYPGSGIYSNAANYPDAATDPGTANDEESEMELVRRLTAHMSMMVNAKAGSFPGLSNEAVLSIFHKYQAFKHRHGLVDFDDILLETWRVLREDQEAATYWQQKYRYILIDEFQDINELQYQCMHILEAPWNNLYVVGDEDQSIYGFRGSSPGIIHRFLADHPGCRTVTLENNYRAPDVLLVPARNLIRHNRHRTEKDVIGRSDPEGAGWHLQSCSDQWDEYRKIAETARQYQSRGIPLNQQVILLRSFRNLPDILLCMQQCDIPTQIIDAGQMHNRFESIRSHFITKDILTYFQLARSYTAYIPPDQINVNDKNQNSADNHRTPGSHDSGKCIRHRETGSAHSPDSNTTHALSSAHSPDSNTTHALSSVHSPDSSSTRTLSSARSPDSNATHALSSAHSPDCNTTHALGSAPSIDQSISRVRSHNSVPDRRNAETLRLLQRIRPISLPHVSRYSLTGENPLPINPQGQYEMKTLEKHLSFLLKLPPYPALEYILKAMGYEKYLSKLDQKNHSSGSARPAAYMDILQILKDVLRSIKTQNAFIDFIQHGESYTKSAPDHFQGAMNQPQGTLEQQQGAIKQPLGVPNHSQGASKQQHGTLEQPQGGPEQLQGGPQQSLGTPKQSQGTPNHSQGASKQPQGALNLRQGAPALPQGTPDQLKGTSDALQIRTMHSSKGLEYQVVYIPDLNKGTIPDSRAVGAAIEEERRLLYVAMTRARRHLQLYYVEKIRGKQVLPSIFAEELFH